MLSVDEFREALLDAAPQAADSLELAALSESLGLTDAGAQRLGYEDVFAFAEWAFISDYKDQFREPVATKKTSAMGRLGRELKGAGSKISNGLSYSLPWMFLTLAERLFPRAFEISPALGSVLSLSIIASLITTGGIAQAITRDVTFFLALGEPQLARRSVQRLIRYGLMTALLIVFCAAFLCLYFGLFPLRYLMIGSVHYLLFCGLWMLCAALSAQGLSLLLPLALLGSAGAVVAARHFWHTSSVVLLLLWPCLAGIIALTCSAIKTYKTERCSSGDCNRFAPHESIHHYMLLPTILYGASYFSFLFADRLCAGSAVAWSSGLPFGVEPVYKQAMDLALLAFLLGTIVVEYVGDLFVRYWWSRVCVTQQSLTSSLTSLLRRRYCAAGASVVCMFLVILLTAYHYLPGLMALHRSLALEETLWLGGMGYLILSVALLGSVVLLSVDAVAEVTKASGIGLLVNLLVGYTMSHAVAMQFASAGLLAGSCVFAWRIHKALWDVLAQPDYYYSLV